MRWTQTQVTWWQKEMKEHLGQHQSSPGGPSGDGVDARDSSRRFLEFGEEASPRNFAKNLMKEP